MVYLYKKKRMISPAFLQAGDKVAIVATARKVSPAEMQPAISALEGWGLVVETGSNLYAVENQYAGSDQQRAADLQQVLDDPQIRAIVCARGGYGSVRILDKLDFSEFLKNPKWIVGYSDITVLHTYINQQLGIETLHATMPINFQSTGDAALSVEALKSVLFGEVPGYTIETGNHSRNGYGKGVLMGGNLSILYSMRGTPGDPDTEGKILFLEDLDEYLYHIDRMMMNLKRGDKLSRLAGLVVGGMTKMNDNSTAFGKTAGEIIAEAVKEYNYPVLFGFPAGHQDKNMPLILGREVELSVSSSGSNLRFEGPSVSDNRQKMKSLFKPMVFITGFFLLLYLIYSLLVG
jgi:muramoyltetrapeptide carboxypeptidase